MCAASDSARMPASVEASGSGRGGVGPASTKSSATLADAFDSWAEALKGDDDRYDEPQRNPEPPHRCYRTTRTTGTADPGETSFRKRGYG